MKKVLFNFVLLLSLLSSCAKKEPIPYKNIPGKYGMLKKVLNDPEKYKVQILYTRIHRDEKNKPEFQNFRFNVNDHIYYYPASTVKLPVALLALEWLTEQNIPGLTANNTMLTDSVRPSQIPALYDSSSADFKPSIAHYIKKILLVSDNDAYNRLYELLGQDYINTKMKEKGLKNTIINHRLSMPMSETENRHFNPIRFLDSSDQVLYELPSRTTNNIYANLSNPKIGKAYYDNGKLIFESMDFTYKNKFPLTALHGVVQRIVFPEKFSVSERFRIPEEDRKFILKYMSMLPGESDFPKYELPEYYDSFSKFYKFGNDKGPIPSNFRIFNKTGTAYGHLLDSSYFLDLENGIEFFVSAVIYVNENETLNDNTYEYDSVAFPFYKELGAYLYELELNRKKSVPPDLSEFIIEY